MKTSVATIVLFVSCALGATTSLCTALSGDLVNACSGEGTKDLGRNICCITSALGQRNFDIACDDQNGSSENTGNACTA